MALDASFLEALAAVLGPRGLVTDPADLASFNAEERGLYRGEATVVARPDSTDACAEVVRLCATHGVSIVPQGGNTGLCGGAVAGANQIIVSTGRMNRVRWIDADGCRMAVDAGCVLADIQAKARDAGCLFPLSLGAEGSCQIGGNLATNAGGVGVLHYGNTRDLCLGLEVVLPDGRIWNGMRALEKDNTGYALRQLFIGSEGTLGLITGAVLKLFPAPTSTATALCGFEDLSRVTRLLSLCRSITGDDVTAFELIPRFGLEIALEHLDGLRDPLEGSHPWYALVELSTSRPGADLNEVMESLLGRAFEEEILSDAVITASLDQRASLWRLREGLPEAQKHAGASIKHDVSVPLSQVPTFIERASAAVTAACPGIRPCPFGHVGDGNIHFNLTQPKGMDKQAFLDRWEEMNRLVHDIVADLGGSISAEHGIGRLKVDEMRHYKAPLELDLMRALKTAFDPAGLMNPGVILPATTA
ncbi:FAD-binding oxidoreductase [Pararhodospirillum photometricum]|uniref:FAD-binding oxidoreductase n=1 Tax=Pararhodospirillum photometricum TaxID=1084 RepID=UPI0002DCC45F|nr:FAD-binding oxidoreductase [Pararhodospirillum photometricum]